MKFFGYLN